MPSKPILFAATAIAFLCMVATSQAQSPFSSCPNCQLRAAAAQSAPVVQPAQRVTFTPQAYAVPAPMQFPQPVQYVSPYPMPQMTNYTTPIVTRPVYNSTVYRAPIQRYQPVYRNYGPTVRSGCGGY